MIEEEKDKVHEHESPHVEDSQGNEDEQDEYVGPSDPAPGDEGGEPTGPGKSGG